MKRLGDFIKLVGGGTPSKSVESYWNGEIPWMSVKDLKSDFIANTQDCITKAGLENSSAKLLEAGTIIIATRMAVGKPAITKIKTAINQDLKGVLIKKDIDKLYLFYLLKSKKEHFESVASGATVKGIKISAITDLKIPLPPLPEQKKIAAILDAADAYHQKTKALIEKYDALTQSLFLDMFGDTKLNQKKWPIKSLVDICEEIVDCPHSTPRYVEDITDYPCIRTTELDNGSINWTKMKYLDHEGYLERTKRLIPKAGDIIYGREGTFGEAAIVPMGYKMSLGQRVMLFRPKKDILNSRFLHAVVRSKGLYHQALRVNSGSTVGHINVKDIKKFKIIIAPLPLQNQFAERVKKIEAQKAKAQASLEKAENLFNSLLQRAFKGELTS